MPTEKSKQYKSDWNKRWRLENKELYRTYNREYQRRRRARLKLQPLTRDS